MHKIGVDIVHIPRIEKLEQRAKEKIFQPTEQDQSPQTLAGIFAAKEALKKATGIGVDWLDIEIKKNKQGKPYIYMAQPTYNKCELSISHDGEYAIAMVICQ